MNRGSPSIATSCDDVLATIRTVATEITAFSRTVRPARKDLDLVTREIASLEATIDFIQHDAADVHDVPGLDRQLHLVLQQCESVLQRLSTHLNDWLPGGARTHIPWSLGGKGEMATIKGGLEAHHQMLEMNLGLINL
jgi:hypothetical protein